MLEVKMEVYIEYVIFDNFVIDMIILLLTCKTLGIRPHRLRLVTSTCFGVVCAVFSPFLSFSMWILLLIKICMGVVVTLLLKKYKSAGEFALTFVLFVTYTFVLGGVCYALCLALGSSTLGVLINAYQLPMGAIVLVISFYIYLLTKLIVYFRKHNKTISLYYDVVITLNNKNYYVRGYVDSGNNLYSDGRPVVVLSRSSFCKTFKDFPYEKLLLCKPEKMPYKNAHFVDFYTASGNKKMLVFDIDKIEIINSERKYETTDVLLGVSSTGQFSGTFDCLLNKDFL